MATIFDVTQLEKAWYVASQKDFIQANESRGSIYGVLDTLFLNREKLLLSSQIEGLRTAASRPVSIAVLKKEPTGTATARACDATDAGQGSGKVDLTWGTISENFYLTVDELMGANNFTFVEVLQHRFREKLKSMHARIDALGASFLSANISAGNGSVYTRAANVGQIPLSDYSVSSNSAALWFNKVKAEMLQNDYPGAYQVVGDTYLSAVVSAMLNQGAGNANNLSFQFQDGSFRFSNRISNPSGANASAYVMQEGQATVLSWTKPKNRQDWSKLGIQLGESKGAFYEVGNELWGTMVDPVYGWDIEMKIKGACFDNSGSFPEAEDDFKIGFVLSIDIANLKGYSSDSNTGIYEYSLLNA